VNDFSEPQDAASIREKMLKDIGQVPWSYLAPHALAGNLFFVDPELRLDEVGVAIAMNEDGRVREWLKSRDVMKIEEIHTAQWQEGQTEFEALVVMPFILCRPAAKR
jgi:hypothetical protein